jgi:uncharacterized repeat protein (TIGR03803 family)
MKKLLPFRIAAYAIFLLCLATGIAAPAQTFTTLVNFDGTNGSEPSEDRLVQGLDGNLYGTTYTGGAYQTCLQGCGTVFKMSRKGTLTTLHSFDSTDGGGPAPGLLLANDGNFYGTTVFGGANFNCSRGCGTVFRITAEGALATLYNFCFLTNCADGEYPQAGLIQGTDGNFYGTTNEGGNPGCNAPYGCGTVFKLTPGGTLTTLYIFNGVDGSEPSARLIQAADGSLYGTTDGGGYGYGNVFKITSAGVFTNVYSFCAQGSGNCTDGISPYAGLVQASDATFFGTTAAGGNYSNCGEGCGTVYKLTPGGTLTTLYSFNKTDGSEPFGGLAEGTDGNFYGTTFEGGNGGTCTFGCGTVFKMTPAGVLTTLHNFVGTDGADPNGGLAQATNGNFYGTASFEGANNDGTAFSLVVGLGPFVETLPALGKVGTSVIILGNGLTGTTSVTFNGTPATFKVASLTEVKTTVPTGATTGRVQVTTPNGTLTSNVDFRVK